MKLIKNIAITFCFISCYQKTKIKNDENIILNHTFSKIIWDKNLLFGVDTFINQSNCNNCLFEMFIDKLYPNYTLITLKSRTYSSEYANNMNPLFTSTIHGHIFYIYSGIEDFLKPYNKTQITNNDSSGYKFNLWTLIMHNDSVWVKKEGAPFFPSSELKFTDEFRKDAFLVIPTK